MSKCFGKILITKKQSRENNNNKNNLEKSYTEKRAKHDPSGWAMFKNCSFDKKENKCDYLRGKIV